MTLPNRAQLDPISRHPFQLGAYHINIHSSRDSLFKKTVLCIGSDANQMVLIKPFHPLGDLAALLKLIGKQNLWGQKVGCWAYYLAVDGVIDFSTKSNVQSLAAPVRPYQGIVNASSLGGSLPPLKYLFPPTGRRLLSCAASHEMRPWSSLDFGGFYFIDSAGYLETADTCRGFDRYTFILALYALNFQNYNLNVSTGLLLAQYIGTSSNFPMVTGTWSQIKGSMSGWDGTKPTLLLWTGSSVHLMFNKSGSGSVICGFNSLGYSESSFDAWLPETSSTIYNVRSAPPPKTVLPKPGWSPGGWV